MERISHQKHYFGSGDISRPHTINNIVNTTDIDNIIDRKRSCIDVLTEILTVSFHQYSVGAYTWLL